MELVRDLIIEIINFLDRNMDSDLQRKILAILKEIPLEKKNYNFQTPNKPPKEKSFQKALASIKSKSLLPLKTSLYLALKEMKWNIDNGSFYEKNSFIGNRYLNGNMNSELIGPIHGNFKSGDSRLGLFLLEPNIFYKDHKHEAPELYLNLTNGTHWRFGDIIWEEKNSGSIVYNKPNMVHAMKVNKNPFLSIWCWPYNSSKKCVLVSRKDWVKFE